MATAKLVVRNLLRHPLRSLLTVASLVVALFLLCTLRSLVTTLDSVTEAAASNRLIVQSAVSLYVDLPLSYQAKIEQVPGVVRTCKWQWFGGYYQDPSNFFGQFAIDPETFFAMYPEVEVVEGTEEAFRANRRGCVVGEALAQRFGWKLGDSVPLVGKIFPHPDGPDAPWEFRLEALYRPTKKSFDASTFFFHWDYFEKTMEAGPIPEVGMGTVVIEIDPSVEPTAVMAAVDGMFENGPQRVQTTTEAEFNAQFVSMMGNVPFFVNAIGSAVLIAILLACVNTMLMAGREQTHDVGVMKALGFTDGRMGLLLVAQSLVLCLFGGGLGILLALALERPIQKATAAFMPGFSLAPETLTTAAIVTLLVGLVAGLVPAVRAGRLRCVEAFRAE